MSVKKAYVGFLLLLFLCSNCTQDRQRVPEHREESFIPYTIELATILIPSSWQKKDYEPNSESAEEPYVFIGPYHQKDSLLGDAILVTIKRKEGKPNLKRLQDSFVENMEVHGQNKVKMLSFQDSVFADGGLVLVDYDNTIVAQNLNQICTYGGFYRKGVFVSIISMARRGSTQENLEKRRLFRKVIHSLKWITN
ncbi:hypothetical protein LF252_09360 [Hymenobacter sp. BT728]|nr:hypothetical protein [Hymenobacter pini]